MINEALQLLSDPFLARRAQAENAFDCRFEETVLDCEDCDGVGWFEGEPDWLKCSKCHDGEIYTKICWKCDKGENDCDCNVEDFLR